MGYKRIESAQDFRKAKADWERTSAKDADYRKAGRRGWTSAAKQMIDAQGALASYAVRIAKSGYPIADCCKALEHPRLLSEFARHLYYERDMRQEWLYTMAQIGD